MTIWTNADGLRVKFLEDERTQGQGGTYATPTEGGTSVTSLTFDFTELADANAVADFHVIIPNGVMIEEVAFKVITAFVGTNAVLDVGVIDLDNATAGDDDYLIAAAPVTDFAAIGNRVVYNQGSDEHGVGVGAVTTTAKLITIGYDTAAFTAGKAEMLIKWSVPQVINS